MKKTLLLFLLLPFFGFAQTALVKWDAANSSNRYAPVPIGTINGSDLSATVTNTYTPNNAANTFFASSGWPTPLNKGGQYDLTKYVQFALGPKTGNKVNLTTFSFECKSPGSQKYTIKYSKQSDFSSGVYNLLTATSVTSDWIQYTLNFSEEINPVLPTEKVYIRIYAYYTNNDFQIRTGSGNIVPTINGEILSFDSTKILAINDYVTTTKDVAVNINPLSNDVNKANVTTLVISTPPSAAEGTAIINPDKTITFNPAAGFLGTSVFNYTISNATETSTGTIKVTVNQDTTDFLSLWDGADDTFNPVTKQYVDPNSPITKAGTNISLDYIFQNPNNAFFQTNGWPTPSYNPNIVDKADETKYIQFKIAPDSKHKLNLKQFNFTYRGKNQKFLVKYSKNPDFTNGSQTLIPESNAASSWTSLTNNIASGLNTLSPGETLYIRFYVYASNNTFEIKNGNGSPEGPVITGTIEDVFTLTAKNDIVSTPSNQAVTIPILDNDVIGGYPLEAITVTQPTNGTVTVNGLNNITFTPAANFTGSATFTYTLKNTNSNYSSATVTVNATAPVCNVVGDQIKYGDNKWIGYVYKTTNLPSTGDPVDPNPETPTTLPISNMTYIGQVEENKLFNRDVVQGAVTGLNPQLCESPTNYFFVRYKMKTKVDVTGTYNITVGGDDYYRLYLTTASGTTKIINQWSGVNYSQKAVNMQLTAGVEYTFDLEYYEKTTDSRIQFSMGLIAGNNTAPYAFGDNLWKVYGFTTADSGNNFTIPQNSYAGYYSVNPVNINTTDSFALAESPSFNPAISGWQGAPVPQDYFTLVYKRQGFPCGTYQIQITNCDDQVQIFIDDENATTPVYTSPGNINDNAPVNNALSSPRVLGKNSKVEIRLKDYKQSARLNLNFIKIETDYNGTGTPNSNSSIIIKSNITLNSDLTVCSCTINDVVTLTVPQDVTLTIDENITIGTGGKLLIQSGGSFLQTTTSKNMFTGSMEAFEIQRKTQIRRMDLTYWSTPVNNPNFAMKTLSPETLYDKYFYWSSDFKWATDLYGGMIMKPTKGYSIRGPQSFDTVNAAEFTGKFFGTPNNGDFTVTTTADKYLLIGNPYPSAIDGQKFIRDNGDVGPLLFWTHVSPPKKENGSNTYTYSSPDYAILTLFGATRATTGGETPTGYIGVGQAFMIKPKVTSLVFTNDQRVKAQNTQFFKTTAKQNEGEVNRLWLNLSNSEDAFKQLLIGYAEGATNSFDFNYDATTLSSNSYVDFYTINETKKLTIQARALPFDNTETIPLGYKAVAESQLTISIDHADGFFNTQAVYLEDKTTGIITDLRTSNYTFKTAIGTFTDRFVLRYTNKTLGTDDFENLKDGVLVSVKSKAVNVTSGTENIKEVQIYTIGGQMLYNKTKVDTKELEIKNLYSGNQVLLVKVILENNSVVTKKIIYN